MRRLDLVQLTIIIAGIISAFFCLRLSAQFLVYFFSWFSDGLRGGYMMESFIQNIILLALYLLFSMLAIKNSKNLAEWISTKANLNTDINFALDRSALLFALFLGLGIYGLIEQLPLLFTDVYHYMKDSRSLITEFDLKKPQKELLIIQSIKVALYLILVIYARVFAEFFAAKIHNPDPADEINKETE